VCPRLLKQFSALVWEGVNVGNACCWSFGHFWQLLEHYGAFFSVFMFVVFVLFPTDKLID